MLIGGEDGWVFVPRIETRFRLMFLDCPLRRLIGGPLVRETRGRSLRIVHDLLVSTGCLRLIYSADKGGQRGTFVYLVHPPRKVRVHCYS